MQEQHSQVNFKKLVADLADMYPDHPFDVVITELVANSLDAKAKRISLTWEDNLKVLVVEDDGQGMDATQFKEYHDFATELKHRGSGIGFAGVGAKIGFNIADRVVTETRSKGAASASDWQWHSDGSLRWKNIPLDRLTGNGTRVEVHFRREEAPPEVDNEYLIRVLKRHYLPLFVEEFGRAYAAMGIYLTLPQFLVNGSPVLPKALDETAGMNPRRDIKLPSDNRPVGLGSIGVTKNDPSITDHPYGVLLCTHGKVIKSELFGQSTGALGTRLFGMVEIPKLVDYLTTNKSDLKGGPGRSKGLNRLLDPVREELKAFLADQGIAVVQQNRNQLSAKLERELTKMIRRLPELQDFDGLLRRSRTLRKSEDGNVPTSEARTGKGDRNSHRSLARNGDDGHGGSSRASDRNGATRAKRQRRRRNQGPRVAFEEHPARNETAWLDSNTVVINSGHTAYRQRVNQDQARLTYCMFAIGVALDKAELVESRDGVSYVDKFIAAWGSS